MSNRAGENTRAVRPVWREPLDARTAKPVGRSHAFRVQAVILVDDARNPAAMQGTT